MVFVRSDGLTSRLVGAGLADSPLAGPVDEPAADRDAGDALSGEESEAIDATAGADSDADVAADATAGAFAPGCTAVAMSGTLATAHWCFCELLLFCSNYL